MAKLKKTKKSKKFVVVTLNKSVFKKTSKKSKKKTSRSSQQFLKLKCEIIPQKRKKSIKRKVKSPKKTKSIKRKVKSHKKTKSIKRKVKSPKKTKSIKRKVKSPNKTKSIKRKVKSPKKKISIKRKVTSPKKKISIKRKVTSPKVEKIISKPVLEEVILEDENEFCKKITSKDECESQFDTEGLRRCRYLLKDKRCENLPEQFKRRATLGVGGDADYKKIEFVPGKLNTIFDFKEEIKPKVKVGKISEKDKMILQKQLGRKDNFCDMLTSKEECESQFDDEGLRRCRYLLKDRKCENLPEQFKRRATLGVGGDADYKKIEFVPGKLDLSKFTSKQLSPKKPLVIPGKVDEKVKQRLIKKLEGKDDEDVFCEEIIDKEDCESQFDTEGLRRCRYLLKDKRCEKLPDQFKRRASLGISNKEMDKPIGKINPKMRELLSKRLLGKDDEDIFCEEIIDKENCESQLDDEGLRRCRYLLKDKRCEKLPVEFKKRATFGLTKEVVEPKELEVEKQMRLRGELQRLKRRKEKELNQGKLKVGGKIVKINK
jgi:hypothetical protein